MLRHRTLWLLRIREAMTDSHASRKTVSPNGSSDTVVEESVAEVNGHRLDRCKGWQHLTPQEIRDGMSPRYTFFRCTECGRESVSPPEQWEGIDCEVRG